MNIDAPLPYCFEQAENGVTVNARNSLARSNARSLDQRLITISIFAAGSRLPSSLGFAVNTEPHDVHLNFCSPNRPLPFFFDASLQFGQFIIFSM